MAQIEATVARLSPWVRRTPVLWADGADFALPGIRIAFKLEFTQHSGSFKARGAFCNMLTRSIPAAGIIAASGGNHGVAVVFAASRLKLPATIFVPTIASPAKIEQIRAFGAVLRITGERYADALAASIECAHRCGAMQIHAYDSSKRYWGRRRWDGSSSSRVPDWMLYWCRSAVVA